jgi:hypothetical protein
MNADTFIVDGRAYSWRRLCELRRAQVEAQNRQTNAPLFPDGLRPVHRDP